MITSLPCTQLHPRCTVGVGNTARELQQSNQGQNEGAVSEFLKSSSDEKELLKQP